ncbi:MAG: hypothetical protein Q8N83_07980 [Ignavibacteria bacterium]|nr:hypothetical protein [Ignavibacteria bacterium]
MADQKKIITETPKKGNLSKFIEERKFPTVTVNVSMPKVKPPKEKDQGTEKENKN